MDKHVASLITSASVHEVWKWKFLHGTAPTIRIRVLSTHVQLGQWGEEDGAIIALVSKHAPTGARLYCVQYVDVEQGNRHSHGVLFGALADARAFYARVVLQREDPPDADVLPAGAWAFM